MWEGEICIAQQEKEIETISWRGVKTLQYMLFFEELEMVELKKIVNNINSNWYFKDDHERI